MAKQAGLAQQFFAHGYDLSGDVGAINNAASPRGVVEVTALNKSAVERLLTHGDGLLDFAAWLNTSAGQSHAALSGLPTTDVIVLWMLGGAVDDVAAGLVAKQVNYDGTRNADGSLPLTVNGLANGTPLEWMNALSAGKITHASAGSSATKDDAAGTSNGLAAILQVVDIDSGTPTVLIEDNTVDNGAWATLIAFTAVADGAEPTAERKTVSGTVNRYKRITTTGTFTNLDFAVAYRRGTAQDDVAL